ncbi:MAG: hypothetical protein N2513_00065 [Deltaproteobacteria bacterium]|nr:hypothetical protein [Deltaproteobacteria bacterium]
MVEKATKKKYKLDIKWFPGDSLLKAVDLIEGVEKGISDSATSSCGYNSGKFPKPVETEYAKSLKEKGHDADKIIKTANELVEKYNKLTYPAWKP